MYVHPNPILCSVVSSCADMGMRYTNRKPFSTVVLYDQTKNLIIQNPQNYHLYCFESHLTIPRAFCLQVVLPPAEKSELHHHWG